MLLMWQAWQEDYGEKPPARETAQSQTDPANPGAPGVPAIGTSAGPDVPTGVPQPNEGPGQGTGSASDAPRAAGESSGQFVDVRTDVYHARIDLKGATLGIVDLLQYSVSLEEPNTPFRLLSNSGAKLFMAQSGLIGKTDAPNHHAMFKAAESSYNLADGSDEVTVDLVWEGEGVRVTKSYTFKRDSYEVGLRHTVDNTGNAPWTGGVYGQFRRAEPNESRGLGTIYTYTGGVVSSPEKPYEKYDFDDMADQDLNLDIKGGWVAIIQHYFAGAWIPSPDVEARYYSIDAEGGQFVLGVVTPNFSVQPGASGSSDLKIYIGPKIQERLLASAPGLERTVDYGWLFFIAQPLYVALQFIHGLVGNWGWAIIFLTILIKLIFYPLSNASYKSMARMRKLSPKMTALKERYGSDRQKLNQAMMEMYKKEKINPLGGCLPIVVQIPVFISLYWVLLETVELRQAPFMLWLQDLATHDPYYVLPILMGASMFAQQRLSPAPPDPIQAKVMMAMPIVFTFFFLFFPSGLVLYWLCNNLLSIAQQWFITRKIESGQMK